MRISSTFARQLSASIGFVTVLFCIGSCGVVKEEPNQSMSEALGGPFRLCWLPQGVSCSAQEIQNELTSLNNLVAARAAGWANGCGVAMCTGASNSCVGSGWGAICNTCQAICGRPGNCRFINSCIKNSIPSGSYPCLGIKTVFATCGKDHMLVLVSDNCGNPLEYIDGWACINNLPTIAQVGSTCYDYWLGSNCPKACSADCSCYPGVLDYCMVEGGQAQCFDSTTGAYVGEPCTCGSC